MRVGVMADSHDRIPAVEELLRRMSAAGVGLVLHAGDYCSPFALNPFRDLNMALAGVFGNNDGDREGIKAIAAVGVGGELYDSPHSVELEGKRLLIVHGDDRPDAVARLRDALDQFQISGVATNLSLLKTIVAHLDFREGRFDTRWLETVLLPGFIARKDC